MIQIDEITKQNQELRSIQNELSAPETREQGIEEFFRFMSGIDKDKYADLYFSTLYRGKDIIVSEPEVKSNKTISVTLEENENTIVDEIDISKEELFIETINNILYYLLSVNEKEKAEKMRELETKNRMVALNIAEKRKMEKQ